MARIHFSLHARIGRIADYAAIAERPRTEFHATLKPADNLIRSEDFHHLV